MRASGLDEQNDKQSKLDSQNISSQLRLGIILLLILVAFSFSIIGFLIGRTGNYEHYTGQIIDTITIGSGQSTKATPPKVIKIKIYGRVLYSDGSPYSYGKVELRSTPRYTETDADGRFEFADVEPGKHIISIFKGGAIVASADITIKREVLITSNQVVKIKDNTFYILAPLDLFEIDLLFNVDTVAQFDNVEQLDGTPIPGLSPRVNLEIVMDPKPLPPSIPIKPPVLPPTTPPEKIDGNGDLPDEEGDIVPPSIPTKPPILPPTTPGGGTGGGTGGTPGGGGFIPAPERAPNIVAGDNLNPTQAWATLSTIDLFAERSGNYGVQTISGKNVIAPGSHGSYVFRIKNPETKLLAYSISLSETDENNPRLPMMYRLKRGTSGTDYIGGNGWKSADNLSLGLTPIPAGAVSYYTLEWKWDSSNDSLDTSIGKQSGTPVYILNIIVTAQFQ